MNPMVVLNAEIGEALTTNDEFIYLAIRKTGFSKIDENVSIGDSLIVLSLDVDGVIQWEYRKGMDEAGMVPKDIIMDSDGNLAILVNNISTSGIQGTMILKLDQNGNQLQVSNSYYGNTSNGATSFELIEYPAESYYTICNDIGGTYPISVLFDMYNANNITSYPYTNQTDKFLYGFTLKNSDSIYAAGFSIYEGDTDAYIVEIDSAFSISKIKRHGTEGTELLKDIGQTSEGFIVGGLANNQGEGGFDCYLFQVTPDLNSISVEETIGSEFDETFHHMRVKLGDPKAYFAGQTLEFGEYFGNALVGGSLTFPQGASPSNCHYERVAYFQDAFSFDSQGEVIGTNNLIKSPSAFFAMAHKYNIDHIIFYDLEKVFRFYQLYAVSANPPLPIGDPSTTTQDEYLDAMWYILNLINTAQRDQEGLTFGMTIGLWSEYSNRSVATNDAIESSNLINASNPGKISFYVIENEFWNFATSGEKLEDENGFRTSTRMVNLFGSLGLSLTGSIHSAINSTSVGNSVKAEALAAYYYYQLKERKDLALQLFKSRHTNANIQYVADYMASIQFNTGGIGYWSGNQRYYTSYDVGTSTGNPTSVSKTAQENWILDFLVDGFSNVVINNNPQLHSLELMEF